MHFGRSFGSSRAGDVVVGSYVSENIVCIKQKIGLDALEEQWEEEQQVMKLWQTRGEVCHVAVVAVAAVNSDSWSSVALTVGLAAERLVRARLHHTAVMAHHHSTGVRVTGTGFGALPVAVLIIGAHASITHKSFTMC